LSGASRDGWMDESKKLVPIAVQVLA